MFSETSSWMRTLRQHHAEVISDLVYPACPSRCSICLIGSAVKDTPEPERHVPTIADLLLNPAFAP